MLFFPLEVLILGIHNDYLRFVSHAVCHCKLILNLLIYAIRFFVCIAMMNADDPFIIVFRERLLLSPLALLENARRLKKI